jgi:hypothetical protein
MTKTPVFLASGQGVVPLMILGIPAAIVGVVCVVVAVWRGLTRADTKKGDTRLIFVGLALIAFLFVSPRLDPLVFWFINRFSHH